jgi:hypothetical protein
MILRMKNIKTRISMMNILLKKYSDQIDSIQTNIPSRDNNIQKHKAADNIFDYSFGFQPNEAQASNIWYISRIDFIE